MFTTLRLLKTTSETPEGLKAHGVAPVPVAVLLPGPSHRHRRAPYEPQFSITLPERGGKNELIATKEKAPSLGDMKRGTTLGAYTIEKFNKVQENYRQPKSIKSTPPRKLSQEIVTPVLSRESLDREPRNNLAKNEIVYFGCGRFVERRPTHAYGGVRIGEASNPGPPKKGAVKPTQKHDHRLARQVAEPKRNRKVKLSFHACNQLQCCVVGHHHEKVRGGLDGAAKRLREKGQLEEREKPKDGRKPTYALCKTSEFGHKCPHAHWHDSLQCTVCPVECDNVWGDYPAQVAAIQNLIRKEPAQAAKEVSSVKIAVAPIAEEVPYEEEKEDELFLDEDVPVIPPPVVQQAPPPPLALAAVARPPLPLPQAPIVIPPIPVNPIREVLPLVHPLDPDIDVPAPILPLIIDPLLTEQRILYTTLSSTDPSRAGTWTYAFISLFVQPQAGGSRNLVETQFFDEIQEFASANPDSIDEMIMNSCVGNCMTSLDQIFMDCWISRWLPFRDRLVHDMVQHFGFVGSSNESIYISMLELMRTDPNIVRYSTLNCDFSVRSNTRPAMSRIILGDPRYNIYTTANSQIVENTISYFHWKLLIRDFITLKRSPPMAQKLGNAKPSARIMHLSRGGRR